MKFNFRKVASVITSAVMLGSTAGFAFAATYPAPFVTNGVPDAAIVAVSGDAAASTTIQNDLNSKITATGGVGEESVKIERSSDKLNLGDNLASVFVTSITDDNLPTLLEDGVYYDDNNNEFEYTQKIELGSLTLTHFADSDYNDKEPTIGFHLSSGAHVLNYTLDFTTDPDWDANDLETTDITMLGKNYYILDVDTANDKITLLDSGTTATITEGETSTVNVGGKSYTISIVWVDSDEVKLNVNGEETNILQTTSSPYKLSDGTYIGVKEIMYNPKDTGVSKVEVAIGSGKLVLESGEEIELNDDNVEGLKAYIYNSSTKLQKIVIEWNVDEETFITPESELEMPALASIKLTMTGFVTPKEEEIKIENDGEDSIELSVPIEDGTATLNLLGDTDSDGVFEVIGKDADERLVTSTANSILFNETRGDEYFVASWVSGTEAESYLLSAEVYTADSANRTKIKNEVTGSYECEDLTSGDTCTIGDVILTVNDVYRVGDDKWVNLSINSGGSFYKLYTKEGMLIYLPYDSVASGIGAINLSASPSTWTLYMVEEDKDENLASGQYINVTVGFNSDNETTVSNVASEWAGGSMFEVGDSDVYKGYVESDLATKAEWDKSGDQYTATITYHGEESYGEVYLSSTTGVEAATVPIVTPDQAADYSDKNLIVVGGSCVNSLAAQIMGVPEGTCGDAQSVIEPGKYLIKVVESPLNADKIAVLVAGWEAEDTQNAANKLIEGTLTTEVGQEITGPATGA